MYDLIIARSRAFVKYIIALMKTHAEITRLSRMNNSIRSMELSLGRKRGVAALCDDDLAALRALVQSQSFKATR